MDLEQRLHQWTLDRRRTRATANLHHALAHINDLEPSVSALPDSALQATFQALRPSHPQPLQGPSLWRAFACIREACLRSLGKRPYDVQVMAGLAMAGGTIAEMATGEGKTLTAALPACALALQGKGVHVATVNAYLAERDFALMQPVFQFLGLSCAHLPERANAKEKKVAYAADVTYGTGYEFGFDFLRDRLADHARPQPRLGQAWRDRVLNRAPPPPSDPMQRPFACAVIDEIDSVLIDEAVTPLIISRAIPPGENPLAPVYRLAHRVALDLGKTETELDLEARTVRLTREGLAAVYQRAPKLDLPLRRAWHEYVEQALRARHLFQRDVHYLCRGDAIEIIDENTGRSFPDRKWRGGLHQAVEAKENLTISGETDSDVTISRQRFYRLYPFLCGMTGTAQEEAVEFRQVYGLEIVAIPRHRSLQRIELPDRVFASSDAAHQAAVAEILARRAVGQPILVGTRTVQQSERLSARLHQAGIPHQLLNAKQDAEEAAIIAAAGSFATVTIATNMAGRGADIPLDPAARQAGGLHVLGIERNEAARIDRQLVGRSARQGDPGSAQFFVSLEDEIPRRHQGPSPQGAVGELDPSLAGELLACQRRAELEARERRLAVMREDEAMDKLKRYLG